MADRYSAAALAACEAMRRSRARLATCQAQTGYHVLVPEALLGGTAEAFVKLDRNLSAATIGAPYAGKAGMGQVEAGH